jgi:hypothetical protein
VCFRLGVSAKTTEGPLLRLRGALRVLNIFTAIDYQDNRSVASDNTEQGKLFFIVPPIAYLKYLEHIFQK